MSDWVSSDGGDAGGQGTFVRSPGDRCQGVFVDGGLLDSLDTLRLHWTGWYRVGLYANDREPRLADTLAQYTPCTFSGYDGLRIAYLPSPSTMIGDNAFTMSTQLVWTHNGGPISNLVYGYYLVDGYGNLRAAERFCDGPLSADHLGRQIKLTLRFGASNRGGD